MPRSPRRCSGTSLKISPCKGIRYLLPLVISNVSRKPVEAEEAVMMGSPEMLLEFERQRQREMIREAETARLIAAARRPAGLARIVHLVWPSDTSGRRAAA